MTRRKRRTSPRADSVPPPSSRGEDRDASERLVQAEGADAPPKRPPQHRRHTSTRPPAPPPSRRATAPGPVPPPPPVGAVPPERPSDPHVVARIRELEERLDRMIDAHAHARGRDGQHDGQRDGHRDGDDDRAHPRSAPPPSRPSRPPPPPEPEGMLDTARELLSTDFYLRKWGRIGLRNRSEEVDEFGYDPVYEQKVLPLFDFLYDTLLPRRGARRRERARARAAACSSRTTRARSRSTG